MTTDITELAQLRAELSNPAIGSKDHMRKLALSLVEALEKSEKTSEARREAIDITHKRAARERDRANTAEEALEKAQAQSSKWLEAYHKAVSIGARYEERIAELESFRTAYMEWSDKTDWVRTDRRFDVVKPLGKHIADVLKAYIEHLESPTFTFEVTAEPFTCPRCGTTTTHPEGWHYCHKREGE